MGTTAGLTGTGFGIIGPGTTGLIAGIPGLTGTTGFGATTILGGI